MGKGSLSAGNYSMTYIYDKNRRVVKNAKALGMIGQELEDKVLQLSSGAGILVCALRAPSSTCMYFVI